MVSVGVSVRVWAMKRNITKLKKMCLSKIIMTFYRIYNNKNGFAISFHSAERKISYFSKISFSFLAVRVFPLAVKEVCN